jgi:tyrosyl-tRNA synthetase
MAFAPFETQIEYLTRGVVDVHVRAELEAKIKQAIVSGKPLRVKAGFDPTRPDLHLGHLVLLTKMRHFQDMGHTAILLVGEFTAMVGDPTGQNDLRPRLSREQVHDAAKTYTTQAYKVLLRDQTEERTNSEWLDRMTPSDMVELLAKMTVSRMLERKDFAKRFAEERPIFQHEFLYPLLQGYDSVALENDVELGGTDQLFNLLVGRDLMPKYGKTAQVVLTTPLLEGIDAKIDEQGNVVGKKMSKSADNYIGLDEAPEVMFRKVMQVGDDVIFRYFDLLSTRSTAEIQTLRAERKNGRSPLEIKALFADELITRLHSAEAARVAKLAFESVYANNAVPDDLAIFEFPSEGGVLWIAKALALSGLCKSTSEAKRMVEQGGVELDGTRVTDGNYKLAAGTSVVARVGSKNRKFARINVT